MVHFKLTVSRIEWGLWKVKYLTPVLWMSCLFNLCSFHWSPTAHFCHISCSASSQQGTLQPCKFIDLNRALCASIHCCVLIFKYDDTSWTETCKRWTYSMTFLWPADLFFKYSPVSFNIASFYLYGLRG